MTVKKEINDVLDDARKRLKSSMKPTENKPTIPKKPTDDDSKELLDHLISAHAVKQKIIETFDDENVIGAFFIDELLHMDIDLMILNYLDPSILILGPMIDFGSVHPGDNRDEETRLLHRQKNKKAALERFLMIGCGVDIDAAMVKTHPDLFVRWTLSNIDKEKQTESLKPPMKFRKIAISLAKVMIEKDTWKRKLIILESLSPPNKGKEDGFQKFCLMMNESRIFSIASFLEFLTMSLEFLYLHYTKETLSSHQLIKLLDF